MNRLSINNGLSTCTPEEAIAAVGMKTLVNAMDDDLREIAHNTSWYSTDAEFIAAYIALADLIVG